MCTTELGRIAVHFPEFEKRGCKLMAHSVDQLKSHVDWVNDIKSYCLDIPGKFPYPIIADPEGKLAIQMGMIDPSRQAADDATARSLFIIRWVSICGLLLMDQATGRREGIVLSYINYAEYVNALFACFFHLVTISPDKKLRLMMVYPTSTGRNVE